MSLTYGAGISYAGGFPSAVVSAGVALVELEAVVLVPAHVEEGDAERPLATKLGVGLLDVTQGTDQLLTWNGLLVLQGIPVRVNKQTTR